MNAPIPPISGPKRPTSRLTGGLILVGLGIVFVMRELGFLTRRGFWPWILIVVGTSLIITHLVERQKDP